ncbi:hypothetical protein MA16_Dca003400 [Dendrobium catenatum]|uniref:Uncharacterized protein n=1 Tax=Dendrobium catenatum TaxID=906689 RepID=A0A2I0XCN3_9ASPA|nr:hypothetical protein MA16_Dca003400 [Dendrobium catenatum]
MTTNCHRPPAVDGVMEDRRTTGCAIFGGPRDVLSSPPTFGDDRSMVFSGLKISAMGNKPLIINEGGQMMKKQLLEVPGKGKGIIIEEIMEKTGWPIKILNEKVNAMVPRAISENNHMVAGMDNDARGGISKEISVTMVDNNSFQALADLEERETIETSTDIVLDEGKAAVEDNKVIEMDISKNDMEGAASVSTEKFDAESSGKEDSAIPAKKKRSKQLKEFGPINSSTRSQRLELEGKGTLGSNPHNHF